MNTPKGRRFVFLDWKKLDEERLAIKSLINKWIDMLCVGLFFPHRNDREWVSIKYRIDPWWAHLFFHHLFLNISVLSQNLKLG